jgi:SAM-dependent methyltransferase
MEPGISSNVMWRQFGQARVPLDNEMSLPPQPLALPIPNAALRESSAIIDIGAFLAIGESWAHVVSHFLPENPLVLDIGCGCGKLARFLYFNPKLRYIGVDLFLPGIDWCRREFGALVGDRFRFEHFDGVSAIYNPCGSIRPRDYRLPVSDGAVDVVVCASLFTHLLETDCVLYLDEIHRALKHGGRAIISIHNEPSAGKLFSGDEARIDIEEAYFLELAKRSGLALAKNVGLVYGQQVLLFETL